VARNVWIEHRTLIALIAVYMIVTVPILLALDRPYPIRLTTLPFALLWLGMTAVWLLTRWLKSPRYVKAAVEPSRAIGAVLVAMLVVPLQVTFQSVKQSIGVLYGFHFDDLMHRSDVFIHGRMPWQALSWLLDQPRLLRALDAVYLSWFAVLLCFIVWLSWTSQRALRARALVAVVLLWLGAGNVFAAAFASAGPCYFGEVTGTASPYTPLLAELDAIGAEHGPLLARVSQQGLWRFSHNDEWTPFIGISAMPSLHVGAAVLMAIVVWRRSLAVGVFLVAFSVLTQIGSVALAWHYAIDGYAGAASAVAAWWAAGRLTGAASTARRPPSTSPSW
jgi:hypothetical protein